MNFLLRILFSERELDLIERALVMYRAHNEKVVDDKIGPEIHQEISYKRALDTDDLIVRLQRLMKGVRWI